MRAIPASGAARSSRSCGRSGRVYGRLLDDHVDWSAISPLIFIVTTTWQIEQCDLPSPLVSIAPVVADVDVMEHRRLVHRQRKQCRRWYPSPTASYR